MPERHGLITTSELAGISASARSPPVRLYDLSRARAEGSGVPYFVVSGRQTFEAGHIPGANFLDLQGEFSDSATELRFMMPGVGQLETAFGRHGIRD